MVAAQPCQCVEVLKLVGVLELRHEVRRAQTNQARDIDADDAADHGRVVRHALEADLRVAVDAEWILGAVVDALRPREARFVHHPGAEHLGPAADGAVRFQVVAAPRRRRRAVEDAAEPARHVAEAIAPDVAGKHAVGV